MSRLFSGFKAAASPHVASLICFLSLIFFLIEQIPSGYFCSASYSIFGAGNKSILSGARGGSGQSHFKGNAKRQAAMSLSLSSPACLPPIVLRPP